MANDDKQWILGEDLAEWCFPDSTERIGPRTDFSRMDPERPFLCLTQKGKDRLAQLRSVNQ